MEIEASGFSERPWSTPLTWMGGVWDYEVSATIEVTAVTRSSYPEDTGSPGRARPSLRCRVIDVMCIDMHGAFVEGFGWDDLPTASQDWLIDRALYQWAYSSGGEE